MKPFSEWTYADAVAEIDRRKAKRVGEKGYTANRAIVEEDDYWQDGETWRGPRGTAEAWAASLKASIEQQFVPGGAIREALGNFARGLFGKEANVQAGPLKPVKEGSEEHERLTKEGEALVRLLSAWWDRVGLWAALRQAGIRSRWATWGALRLWIPPGRLTESEDEETGAVTTRLPTFNSFEEALGAIELHAPEPDLALQFTHPDTQQRAALFHFVPEPATDQEKPTARVELWYVDEGERPATRLRILREGAPAAAEEPATYAWGGALPIAEMEGELLVTDVVRRQEAGLDFAETSIVKVGETAGFRAIITTNAEPSGVWLPTAPSGVSNPRTTLDKDGKVWYLHPAPRMMGPATTTDLVGVKVEAGGQTGEKRATPGVVIADPVDPDYATKGADYRRRRVLELCHQGHLAMIGAGEASGYAYEQARAAFRGDLEWHKSPAEMALLRLLVALIQMAESMTRSPARYLERLRLVVTLTPDAGPIAPDYMAEVRAQVKDGLLSRSTAMARLGVEDTAAELDAIEQDPEGQLAMTAKRVEILSALLAAAPDLSMQAAARVAGWTEEEAKALFAEADAAAEQNRQARDEINDALQRGRQGQPGQEEDAGAAA